MRQRCLWAGSSAATDADGRLAAPEADEGGAAGAVQRGRVRECRRRSAAAYELAVESEHQATGGGVRNAGDARDDRSCPQPEERRRQAEELVAGLTIR